MHLVKCNDMYKRAEYQTIKSRLEENRKFIQVVMGARQIGKSTVVKQVLKNIDIPFQFFSADNVPATNTAWISNCWAATRSLKENKGWDSAILVIDEIQKIANWSEAVKKEWDADTFNDCNIKVLLLGSSRVLLEKGLSESLAGRFEEIRMTHWSYNEMKECFGMTLDQYVFYGGYPGAAALLADKDRFEQYIQSSIIDATINKDILMDTPIGKPALLKPPFFFAYSSLLFFWLRCVMCLMLICYECNNVISNKFISNNVVSFVFFVYLCGVKMLLWILNLLYLVWLHRVKILPIVRMKRRVC